MPKVARSSRPKPPKTENAAPETPFDGEEPAQEAAAPAPEADLTPTEVPPTKPVRTLDFFDALRAIKSQDWGTRACVYLYRLEPITDRLKGGNSVVYIMKYEEPIDQDRILIDHGSGKYRAVFTFRKPGAAQSDQVDSAIVEMLNTAFPPKIPPGEWVNDPRNKKWQWAKPLMPPTPAEQQQQQTAQPSNGIVETFRLFRDMNNDIKEEVKQQQPPPPPPAPPQADPLVTGLQIAKEFMAMKADNPMVEILRDELRESRLRNEKLMDELRTRAAAPVEQKSGFGSLKDLLTEAQAIGLIPEGGLKSLWGKAEGALQAVTRSRMSGTEEFWQPILVGLFDSIKPVLPMVVARLAQPQPPRPQPPQGPGSLPQAPQQQPEAAAPPVNGAPPAATEAAPEFPFDPGQVQNFFRTFGPALVEWFKLGKGEGGDFAEWIYDGYGADWQGLKWMHLKQAVGPENTLNVFKTSPFWPEIAAAEPQFTEFLKAFCSWQPQAAQVVDIDETEEVTQ